MPSSSPHPRTRGLAAVLSVFALAAIVVPAVAGAQQAEQRELEAARARLDELSGEIRSASDQAKDAEGRLDDADERLDEVEQVVNDVARSVERQRGEVERAGERLTEVEAEAEQVTEAFGKRASRMFKQGPNLPFEMLLASDGAQDAVTRTSLLRSVTSADQVSMETLEASQVAVDAERERFEAEEERLERTLDEERELLADVQELRESRALAAANARDEIERLATEQDDLQKDSAALEDLIDEQQAQARRAREAAQQQRAEAEAAAEDEAEDEAAAPAPPAPYSAGPTSSSSSGYAWPMCAPVTSGYGTRWGRQHEGIDQGASTGSPIGAAKGGRVIYAGYQGGYGRLTLIDHGDGVVTAYAHQSRVDVRNGQSVSQGQTIGAVGSTGNVTGPHLHFETRVGGSAVNPRQYLSGGPC